MVVPFMTLATTFFPRLRLTHDCRCRVMSALNSTVGHTTPKVTTLSGNMMNVVLVMTEKVDAGLRVQGPKCISCLARRSLCKFPKDVRLPVQGSHLNGCRSETLSRSQGLLKMNFFTLRCFSSAPQFWRRGMVVTDGLLFVPSLLHLTYGTTYVPSRSFTITTGRGTTRTAACYTADAIGTTEPFHGCPAHNGLDLINDIHRIGIPQTTKRTQTCRGEAMPREQA